MILLCRSRRKETLISFAKLLVLLLFLALPSTPLLAAPPTTAEIDKTVAAAAAYQSGQGLESFRQLEDWVRQSIAEPAQRNLIESALIRLLAPSVSFDAQRFACKQLGIMGSQAALPALSKLLSDSKTSGLACLALSTYPPGPADEVLRAALASATGTSRRQIIETLGDRRDPKCVKSLAALARNSEPSTSNVAISSLGKIGTREAWEALASLRKTLPTSSTERLTEATLYCGNQLAKAGDRKLAHNIFTDFLEPSQPAYIRRGAFSALVALDNDGGEERILHALRAPDPVLRPIAIASVRELPSKTSSHRFAALLPALPPLEQVWMIDSLAVRADLPAREAIGNSLNDVDSRVRRAAITALGRIGDPSAVPLLASAASETTEPDELKAIASALVELGGGGETDRAIILELQRSPPTARALLITVIAQRQGAAANPIVLQETVSANPMVAKAAFRVLARTVDASDTTALLSKLNSPLEPAVRAEAEIAAAAALAKIGSASRRSALVRAAFAQANTDDSRISLLNLLPGCADADALALAKASLETSNPKIRAAALSVLGDWPDLAAWNTLAQLYRNPQDEPSRAIALRGLVRLAGESNAHSDSELLGRYTLLLAGARGDADLKLILGALSGVARPEALELVLPLLSNSAVRPEAVVAVRKIAESIKAQNPEAANAALQRVEAKQ
jgi:HEAT repeat protein